MRAWDELGADAAYPATPWSSLVLDHLAYELREDGWLLREIGTLLGVNRERARKRANTGERRGTVLRRGFSPEDLVQLRQDAEALRRELVERAYRELLESPEARAA